GIRGLYVTGVQTCALPISWSPRCCGKFFSLCRSDVVTTPAPGSSDALDENWIAVAENFDKIYAMSGGYSTDGNSMELQELFEERSEERRVGKEGIVLCQRL